MDETDPPSLEGTRWRLSGATPLPVPLGGVEVTAEFAGGRVFGTSGCNRYTGGYTVDGMWLTIGPGIAATRMFCDEQRNEVERAFLDRLALVRSFSIGRGVLTLAGEAGAPLLVFDAP